MDRNKAARAVELYNAGFKINDIMKETGIRSSQTLYSYLKQSGVAVRPPKKATRKVTITIDQEVFDIIKKENPKNISAWICEIIREKIKG